MQAEYLLLINDLLHVSFVIAVFLLSAMAIFMSKKHILPKNCTKPAINLEADITSRGKNDLPLKNVIDSTCYNE